MDLVGATIDKANIIKEEESKQGHYNYFYPHCPEGIYDVKGYGKITIKNIYNGIDWVIYTNPNNKEHPLKYDFIVHPNADYKGIKIKYLNAQSTSLIYNDTKLKIQTIAGNIEEGNIYTYQKDTKEIRSNYIINKDSTIAFEINDYDKTQTLIIDPLVWATYYGGSDADGFRSICVDSQDNIFITGYTYSSDFPILILNGAFMQGTLNSTGPSNDIIILKFNNQGVRLWSTYYGGASIDVGYSVCTDSHDNIYITGITVSNDLPLQQLSGAYYQALSSSSGDAFILKFSNQGVRLWATYYGGSDTDLGSAICTDSQDNIYITGYTSSTNFSTQQLSGAYWQSSNAGSYDIFILKFNNLGVRQWSTYYGGSLSELNDIYFYYDNICIDSRDNVYLIGETLSQDFPLQQLNGAYWQSTLAGNYDLFILKFDKFGVRQWSTYYGGANDDHGTSACIDGNDNLLITGYTRSTNFPVQQLSGAFWQPSNAGGVDVFILKFNKLGVRIWATYYGGSSDDFCDQLGGSYICVDKCNNIYINGTTSSSNLPTQQSSNEYWQPSIMPSINGMPDQDVFLLKFNEQCVRLWATYYGSSSDRDFGFGIKADNNNNVYFIGEWGDIGANTINPGNGSYFISSHTGDNDDSFIIKIKSQNIVQIPASIQTSKDTICINNTGSIVLSTTGGIGDILKWYKGACGQNYIGQDTVITIPSPLQTTTYYARWEGSCDTSACDSLVIKVIPMPVINLGNDKTLCLGQTIILNATYQNATYLWQDNSTNPTFNVNHEGIYYVKVSIDSICFANDTIKISYQFCDTTQSIIPDIYIPNSFTPNGDGLNDVFNIKTLFEFSDYKLVIYDRWGELLFESDNKNKGWDGTYKGKPVPLDVYIYQLTATIKDTGEQKKITGRVTVVR